MIVRDLLLTASQPRPRGCRPRRTRAGWRCARDAVIKAGNGTQSAKANGARCKGRGGKGSKKLLAGRLKAPAKKPAKKPAAKRTGKNAGLPPSQEWIGEAPDVTGITEVISPDLLPDRLKPKATGLAAWFG